MNRFSQELAEVCRQHPLTEKWLLAPNLRVGHQWLDSVTRAGQAVLNVHVKTIKSMSVDVAAGEMASQGVSVATPRASALLVDRVLSEHGSTDLKYLSRAALGTALVETVLISIQAIRLAGLRETELATEQFEVPAKGQDLCAILAGYREELTRERLIDYADVLEIAIRVLSKTPACLGQDTLVVMPDTTDYSGLERAFLDAIPESQRIRLTSDSYTEESASHNDVRIVRAIGEVNEVRNVLRCCLADETPWDEVEVLHTDQDTYVSLVLETLSALENSEGLSSDKLPVTFAEGISCRYSRPGRALAAWLKWIREDFPQKGIVRLIKEGLLAVPDDEQEVSGFARLGAQIRGLGIGFGRDRYLPALDERISALDKKLTKARKGGESENDLTVGQIALVERNVRDFEALRKLVQRLLDLSPDTTASHDELVAAAQKFVGEAARAVNKLDRFAADKLMEELEDMRRWLHRCDGATGIDVWEWLENLPAGTRVLGSGPRPGCLHVDHIANGGHSGRPNTFILGLDDSRFPGAGLQDPLLLDNERSRLSEAIPTAAGRVERRVEEFFRLLARLRGKVTLSYACQSVTDDREMFPSSVLVSVYRSLSENLDGHQQDMLKWLPSPISFAPRDPQRCIDASEWWLWQLSCDEGIEDTRSLVLDEYPHLARGNRAIEQQTSASFTEFDGHVPDAGEDLDPTTESGPVMSASRLQTLARCPRAFYFQYGLDIAPPDELVIDPAKWLDSLAFGSLIHELFEQFMRELSSESKLPDFSRDKVRLQELLDEHVRRYKLLYPPPNANAFERQIHQLRRTARTFLREEERFCRENNSVPTYFEASLGMSAEGPGTPLDTDEPVAVELAGGKSIRARGRVDRVDRLGAGSVATYAIWDYKSGSTYGYDAADPLRQGRKVQPYLYATIVAHRLREAVAPDARVEYFGFFFPGVRAVGHRMQWTPDELAEGASILDLLCQTVSNGAFVPTTEQDEDCRFCDYRAICGDTDWVAASSQAMLENPANEMLEPFRKLREIDTSPKP